MKIIPVLCLLVLVASPYAFAQPMHKATAPLYRDPIYDGAADPVLIWNREEKAWWMLYTCRRANMPSYDISAYHGNRVGITSSADNGQNWIFRGYLNLEFERGMNTFWAPDGNLFWTNHRTSIQAAPLELVNGTLVADRDKPFDFWLPDMP